MKKDEPEIDQETRDREKKIAAEVQEANKYAKLVDGAESAAKRSLCDALANAFKSGKHLLAAKKLMPHGRWENWLKANFCKSSRTACDYIRIAAVEDPDLQRQIEASESIRGALEVIDESEKDNVPDALRSKRELMQNINRAIDELRKIVRVVFDINCGYEGGSEYMKVYFGLGPGRTQYEEVLKKHVVNFYKELKDECHEDFLDWRDNLNDEMEAIFGRREHQRPPRERLHPVSVLPANARALDDKPVEKIAT